MIPRGQIILLAKGGKAPRLISRELDVPPQDIYEILRAARKAGHDIPKFSPGRNKSSATDIVQIPKAITRQLRPYAKARGVPLRDFLAQFIETAVEHELVEVVLRESQHD